MNYFLIVIMTLLSAFAGFCLKTAMLQSEKIILLLRNKYLYFGCSLYFIGALLNISLLQRMEYSLLLPFGGITYIWTLILSNKLLGEKIKRKKIIGVGFICLGIVFLSF